MTPMLCVGSGWGMYPSQADGDCIQCPACERPVPVGWMTVAGKQVRLIQEHSCRL